jgi:hypothetical protein
MHYNHASSCSTTSQPSTRFTKYLAVSSTLILFFGLITSHLGAPTIYKFKVAAMREEWSSEIRKHADPKNIYAAIRDGVARHPVGAIAEGHPNENYEVGGVGPNGLPIAPDRNRLYLKPA